MAEYNTAKRPLIVFALLLSAAAAAAQPSAPPAKPALPTENVTVSDTKSREVIQDFVSAFAARTQLIDKIARWETGICPITVGLPLPVVCRGGGICTVYLPSAKLYGSTGNRLNSGLRSDFYNIIIAVDISKVAQQDLDAVSDYIALLALTQPASLDICPPLSSVISLLAKGCEGHAVRLTNADMNYLQGLYKMNPEMAAGVQQREIANQMVQALPDK